jgi:hypothetical protein
VGAALKLEANNIAATESSATEIVIWSAAARTELFWRFFILFSLIISLAVQAAVVSNEARTLFIRAKVLRRNAHNSQDFFSHFLHLLACIAISFGKRGELMVQPQ